MQVSPRPRYVQIPASTSTSVNVTELHYLGLIRAAHEDVGPNTSRPQPGALRDTVPRKVDFGEATVACHGQFTPISSLMNNSMIRRHKANAGLRVTEDSQHREETALKPLRL